MPRIIGAVISSGKASLRECQDYYSLEDVYNLVEIVTVDAYNRRIAEKAMRDAT